MTVIYNQVRPSVRWDVQLKAMREQWVRGRDTAMVCRMVQWLKVDDYRRKARKIKQNK